MNDRNPLIESAPVAIFSFLNQKNQKAIQDNPELIIWRDRLIQNQITLGMQAGMFYSDFSTAERQSGYFSHLPHSIAGWSIAALSPENALLQIQNRRRKLEESDIQQFFIIDPFRLPGIQLKDIEKIEDLVNRVTDERKWLASARGVTSGKVAIGGNDGCVRMFQGKTESIEGRGNKKLPQDRADIIEYRDIFSAADSLGYGVENLGKDAKKIGNVIKRFSGELERIVLQTTERSEFLESITSLTNKIQETLGDQRHVFAIRKMIIDYLTKLQGGPHDAARAIQCLRWLSIGHQDRLGKEAGIEHLRVQTIAFTHSHRLEWQPLYMTNERGRIDITSSLARAGGENNAFQKIVQKYSASSTSHVPQPFFGFREAWKKVNNETPKEDIQKLLLKQFAYILLSAIKTEYAYRQNWKIPKTTQDRINELRYIWPIFYGSTNELPEIQFHSQEEFMTDLKKTIEYVQNHS